MVSIVSSDVQSQRISLTIAPTFSSLDESLHLLQHFLSERINGPGEKELPTQFPHLTLDLGILGTRDHGADEALLPAWRNEVVYPLRLYRSHVFLGPLYTSERSDAPCPHCLERRWFWNLSQGDQKAFLYAQKISVYGHNSRLTAFALEAIWQLLVATLQRIDQELSKDGAYPFVILDLETLQVTRSALIQDSHCPICVQPLPDGPEAADLTLVSRPKPHEATHRLHKATDYCLPLSGLVNPFTGMLGHENSTNPVNVLVPVSGTFRVRERHYISEAWWRGHGHTEYQGFYLGLLEGLERYAGHVPHGRQTRIFDSYKHLAPDALDPRECGLYQPSFYEKNAPYFQPFTPELNMPWVWGYSFRQQRPVLVPEQLVYYLNYTNDYPSIVQDCSSGCAIGSCLEEALLYGLLELIERDTFLISWYARLALPRIDPQSCQRPETLFLLEAIEKAGYDFFLFDTRLDLPIPSVMGVARLKKAGPGNFMLSAGCSLDPEEAIQKTLCEIASHVLSFPEMVAHQLDQIRETARDFSKARGLAECGLLYGLPEMARYTNFLFQNPDVRTLEATYQEWSANWPRHQDLLDDLRACMNVIFDLGLDIIVVDQTCRELASGGLKTVSVIVPGLMPLDFGWERDRVLDLPRLRTVPRTSGYRQADFVPNIQHVIPHPFP